MYLQMQQNSEVNIMILCKFVLKQMVLFCQGSGKEYTVSLWVSVLWEEINNCEWVYKGDLKC